MHCVIRTRFVRNCPCRGATFARRTSTWNVMETSVYFVWLFAELWHFDQFIHSMTWNLVWVLQYIPFTLFLGLNCIFLFFFLLEASVSALFHLGYVRPSIVRIMTKSRLDLPGIRISSCTTINQSNQSLSQSEHTANARSWPLISRFPSSIKLCYTVRMHTYFFVGQRFDVRHKLSRIRPGAVRTRLRVNARRSSHEQDITTNCEKEEKRNMHASWIITVDYIVKKCTAYNMKYWVSCIATDSIRSVLYVVHFSTIQSTVIMKGVGGKMWIVSFHKA